MLTRSDREIEKTREALETRYGERAKVLEVELQAQYAARFATLEERTSSQKTELDRQRAVLETYVRHVGVLEGVLTAHNIEYPKLDLQAAPGASG